MPEPLLKTCPGPALGLVRRLAARPPLTHLDTLNTKNGTTTGKVLMHKRRQGVNMFRKFLF